MGDCLAGPLRADRQRPPAARTRVAALFVRCNPWVGYVLSLCVTHVGAIGMESRCRSRSHQAAVACPAANFRDFTRQRIARAIPVGGCGIMLCSKQSGGDRPVAAARHLSHRREHQTNQFNVVVHLQLFQYAAAMASRSREAHLQLDGDLLHRFSFDQQVHHLLFAWRK